MDRATVFANWIARLRRNADLQTTGTLVENENKFCCLGILCRQLAEAGIVEENHAYGDMSEFFYDDSFGTNVLPVALAAELGISTTGSFMWPIEGDPKITFFVDFETDGSAMSTYSLADLNDECKLTFPQIADFIEYIEANGLWVTY